MTTTSKLQINKSNILGAGRGVFATKNIRKGEIIEVCPVLIFSSKDSITLGKTILQNYVYQFGKTKLLISFGFGCLYNHSKIPNARYELDYTTQELFFISDKSIKKGEEITISYGEYFNKKWE